MPTFTPPSRVMVPVVTPNVPLWQQRPFGYFKPSIPRGANVWVYTDNTISEQQPPLWQARTNRDGSITPGVQKVYYGGHIYEITADEAIMLTSAGYGENIS